MMWSWGLLFFSLLASLFHGFFIGRMRLDSGNKPFCFSCSFSDFNFFDCAALGLADEPIKSHFSEISYRGFGPVDSTARAPIYLLAINYIC